MGKTYKVGVAGSLGARYGTTPRTRYSTVVSLARSSHICPRCQVVAARRLSVGVWLCRSCGFKFTGGAYTSATKVGEVAERAARTGITQLPVSETMPTPQKQLESKPKQTPRRRRRKSAEAKEGEDSAEGSEQAKEFGS